MSSKKLDINELSFDEQKNIAISMWRHIKNIIKRYPLEPVWDIKRKFIAKTFINDVNDVWYNDCILCTYVDSCRFCTLNRIDGGYTCVDEGSAYSRACDCELEIKDRLAACDAIISAIQSFNIIEILREEDTAYELS